MFLTKIGFILLISLVTVSANQHDHSAHDWRQDINAFLTVSYERDKFEVYKNQNFKNYLVQDNLFVDMSFFRKKLAEFTATPDRYTEANLDIARNFLKAEYEAINFKTGLQIFKGGQNFIAEKKGISAPEKVLILSSHIDSVSGVKGVNDNASGTIALLAIAKQLSAEKFPMTIRVLGFDQEDSGLIGSNRYVSSLSQSEKSNIIGNINFEMFGVDKNNDGAFHVIDCNRPESVFLNEAISLSIATRGLPLTIVKGCTGRSDHASFWSHNIPAVVVSENFFGGDSDPCYHSKCDVLDGRLNYVYMENIMNAVLNATENLLSDN